MRVLFTKEYWNDIIHLAIIKLNDENFNQEEPILDALIEVINEKYKDTHYKKRLLTTLAKARRECFHLEKKDE